MSDVREALLFLDLDKGGNTDGPLFDEPRRLLQKDPRLRAAWFQYQALRALALETSPEPGEKLLHAVLLQCRRERVSRELARAAGDEDLARTILLGKAQETRSLPSWILGLLLLGSLVLGYLVFRNDWLGLNTPGPANPSTVVVGPDGKPVGSDAVPFEFPVQTPPADAALAAPQDDTSTSDADDTHSEPPAARQARRLLREHLFEADAREKSQEDQEEQSDHGTAAPTPVPTAVPRPTLQPTAVPRPPAPVPAPPAPAAAPGVRRPAPLPAGPSAQSAVSPPVAADMTLSAGTLFLDESVDITLTLPQRRDIDLRLFDSGRKSVRVLAAGAFGPGTQHFPLDARDDTGTVLAPGTYYLRVMTPWFSRVEPLQIQ